MSICHNTQSHHPHPGDLRSAIIRAILKIPASAISAVFIILLFLVHYSSKGSLHFMLFENGTDLTVVSIGRSPCYLPEGDIARIILNCHLPMTEELLSETHSILRPFRGIVDRMLTYNNPKKRVGIGIRQHTCSILIISMKPLTPSIRKDCGHLPRIWLPTEVGLHLNLLLDSIKSHDTN